MVSPVLWTELEYAAARRRRDELVRQRRWKEARGISRQLEAAIRAELERAAGVIQKPCQAKSSVTFTERSRFSKIKAKPHFNLAGTGVAPLSA